MKKLLIVVIVLMGGLPLLAQESDLAEYKSLFIINFLRYVNWPTEGSAEFVIGVVKNKSIADDLKAKTSGKKVGFSNIVVKEFLNAESITTCQLLFVDKSAAYPKNAATIALKTKGVNTLIITENSGSIQQGSAINFVIVDNALKFEISPSNAEVKGLKFSNALLTKNNAILM